MSTPLFRAESSSLRNSFWLNARRGWRTSTSGFNRFIPATGFELSRLGTNRERQKPAILGATKERFSKIDWRASKCSVPLSVALYHQRRLKEAGGLSKSSLFRDRFRLVLPGLLSEVPASPVFWPFDRFPAVRRSMHFYRSDVNRGGFYDSPVRSKAI